MRATCSQVGIEFDPWQQDLNRAMLAKDRHGVYAADTVGISICRQAGKTYDVGGVVLADSIIHPGTTTVWTAHRFKVARESFNELRALATLPLMSAHVDPDAITTGAGNETIPFRNGSRIVFAARERGAIRGFTKVRRLILDEAQILTESAMADLAPTQNQAENPQIVLMGTPPKPTDPAEVFSGLRQAALDGSAEGLLYVEFSADPDCDLDDWNAVAQANPSYPLRTGRRAIRRLRKLLPDEDYAREGLGIWDATAHRTVIDLDQWQKMTDRESCLEDPVAFGVAVAHDRSWSAIGVAGRRSDGLRHVEVIDNQKGTGWVADRLVELVAKWRGSVTVDASGPAGSLIPALTEAGVAPVVVATREVAQACGAFYDAVTDGNLRHLGQPHLNRAVASAKKRPVGDAWVWHRKDSTDISPLEAVTLASAGLDRAPKKKPRSGKVW